ncbi:MAG: hypothetical protein ACK5NV_03970 [Burkholderiales bacterium]|jgi:hypothetical protein
MMACLLSQTAALEANFFLAQGQVLVYNDLQQHPPRLSTMRTMGGYFFLGAEK